MCGLAGALGYGTSIDESVIRGMNDVIAHRGPDDFGVWRDGDAGVALGHRRLAIVDLSAAGHQPMVSTSGRYVIAFNGEVYNHLDLRDELARLGRAPAWRGHSDTETLLAGIEAWGLADTLRKSTGMFAIALWDRDERTLQLARDRMGEKPLYYGWQGQGESKVFLFGSELKALKAHPAFRAGIERGAVALFLQHNYVPAPWSIYAGMSKLEPGCLLKVSNASPEPVVQPYWSFLDTARRAQQNVFTGTDEEAVDGLQTLALDVIRKQMVADVPLGAFLSGGIDSSLVVSLMQAQSARRVKTFTIGFAEAEYNEAEHAKRVAEHLGTEHTELYVSAREALDVIPMLPQLYCEPFADSSQIPTFLVSKLARRHVTVSLSGDAGDELFAGYTRYARTLARWTSLRGKPLGLRRGFAAAIDSIAGSSLLRTASLPLSMKLRRASSVLAADTPDDLYHQLFSHVRRPLEWTLGAQSLETAFTRVPPAVAGMDPLHRMMAVDAVSYLPDDILVKVDRAAMAVSLETRVPFLDHRFVEFAWSLPTAMKVRDGQTKWALRQVLYKHVPRQLIERPKMGFGVPIDRWLRAPLRDWAEDLLGETHLRQDGFFEPRLVRELWRQHQAGTADWSFPLWNVLMFQAWLRSA